MMWTSTSTTNTNTLTHNINDVAPQQLDNYCSRRPSHSSHSKGLYVFPPNTESSEDLDNDSETRSRTSTTSSPQSTAGSFPLTTFDSLPLPASIMPKNPHHGIFKCSNSATQARLHGPTSTVSCARSAPLPAELCVPRSDGRSAHHRDPSLSSLSSLSLEALPFPHYWAKPPGIAVQDSNDFAEPPVQADHPFHLTAKAPSATPHDTLYANYSYCADNPAVQAYANMLAPQKHRGDCTAGVLLPPPELSNLASRPGSVASSVVSDSPATPAAPEPTEVEQAGRRTTAASTTLPKLDRTMTDACLDELYHPNFQLTPALPSAQPVVSPTNETFAQRVQDANKHLTATSTPAPVSAVPRGRSPFRDGSALAPKLSEDLFPQVPSTNQQYVRGLRRTEQTKQEETAQAFHPITQSTDTGTPQTISPKDSIREYPEDEETKFPLFSPHPQSSDLDANHMGKATTQVHHFNNLPPLDNSLDSYLTPQLSNSPHGMQLPQQYPFVPEPRQQPALSLAHSLSMAPRPGPSESPPAMASSPQRPANAGAEGGTYTCTYHGCTQRFATPMLLQKHKREGHRQAHGLHGLRRCAPAAAAAAASPTAAPAAGGSGSGSGGGSGGSGSGSGGSGSGSGSGGFLLVDTQAGPHKCERTNPSTGKPCNTVFSRPYDLTRHEDTIHNGRKHKVRCDVCAEEKTFSRADALTRHYRVCHPDLEFPGKHRKRGSLH